LFEQGNEKLNLAFIAYLFNAHSGLELPSDEELQRLKQQNENLKQQVCKMHKGSSLNCSC
jgi:hypothetical protein